MTYLTSTSGNTAVKCITSLRVERHRNPRSDGSPNSTHQVAAAFCYTNSLQPCPVESLNSSGSQLPQHPLICRWFVVAGFRETHLHSIPVYDTFCVVLMSLQSPTSRQLSPFHSRGFLGRALWYQPHKRSSWKHACSTLHLYADNSIGKWWEMCMKRNVKQEKGEVPSVPSHSGQLGCTSLWLSKPRSLLRLKARAKPKGWRSHQSKLNNSRLSAGFWGTKVPSCSRQPEA